MKQLNKENYEKPFRPVKILQFGEGNFLRAFADWIVQRLNNEGVIDAGVAVVQTLPQGRAEMLRAQDGLYTLCVEGIDNGEQVQRREIIDVLQDFIDPYTQYDKYLNYAHSEQLETVISDTAETGIVLDSKDVNLDVCPRSFPGKLLAFLYERYSFFNGDPDKGLAVLPCESMDNNGAVLKRILVQLAQICNMDDDFIEWLTTANHFTDTLADRTVLDSFDVAEHVWAQTGYKDDNVVKADVFYRWVLKKEPFVEQRFPADKGGLYVIFAPDLAPYKKRQVKVLGGSLTAMAPIAYMCGTETVGEAMDDPDVGRFVEGLVLDEIEPAINLPKADTASYADGVLDRFRNPFIRQELLPVASNSTSKFTARLIPVYNDYLRLYGTAPRYVMFAFAATVIFLRGRRGNAPIALQDEARHLEFWRELWQNNRDANVIAREALSYINGGLATQSNIQIVSAYLTDIVRLGMRGALQKFLEAQD